MTSVRDAFESMAWGTAPESATLANEWLDRHERRFGQFINGEWTAPSDTFAVINPATGKELAQVTQGSDADVDAAVAAARAALPGVAGARRTPAGRAGSTPLRAECSATRGSSPWSRARQRQADSRVARHRHPARGAALLSPRRLGAAARSRVPRDGSGGRGGAGDPVELSAADDGVEDRAGDSSG